MTEIQLDSDKTSFRVELREYKENKRGKRLISVVKIQSKDYDTFCKIVEAVKPLLEEIEKDGFDINE